MDEKSKTITKTYFICPICNTKMESIDLGKGGELFSFGSSSKALYCNNKECDKFGYLTVAGIKKEE